MVAAHLSYIVVNDTSSSMPIGDEFMDEKLFDIDTCQWFANIINYLAAGHVPSHWSLQERRKLFNEAQKFDYESNSKAVCSQF